MNEKVRAQLELFLELERYERNGIPLFLSGIQTTSFDVVNEVAVKEENIYMADYVRDDSGCLQQIRFDRIDAV